MARRYARDRRGRFAPKGSGATARGGRLTTASGKRYQRQTMRSAASPAGRFRRGKAKPAATGPRNSIRHTGTLKRKPAAINIRRTNAGKRTALAFKKNAIRSYRPVTEKGIEQAIERNVGRIIKEVKRQTKGWKGAGAKAGKLLQRFHRSDTRTFLEAQRKDMRGKIARIETSQFTGKMYKGVRETISRRASRAAAAAARGSKAGQRAQGIYDRQLAFTGAGKPAKGKNNYRPGPSNKRGTPRRRRKKR